MSCSDVTTIPPPFQYVNSVYKRFISSTVNVAGHSDGAGAGVSKSLLIGTRGTVLAGSAKSMQRIPRQARRQLQTGGTGCGGMIALAAHGGALQRSADAQRGGGQVLKIDHCEKRKRQWVPIGAGHRYRYMGSWFLPVMATIRRRKHDACMTL